MLSIGEFSKICQVSTKTLRYYAEIGLILPDEINLENGYRYYSCLLYTSPSPRDYAASRMPSSA